MQTHDQTLFRVQIMQVQFLQQNQDTMILIDK